MKSPEATFSTRLAPAVAVKFVADAEGVIEGYAATFGGPPDSYGEIIDPGAFTRTLREHAAAGTAPVFLWSHNRERPIGRWESLEEDDTGLRVVGRLNLASEAGAQAFAHLRARDITGLSIGYRVPAGGSAPAGDGARLRDIDLLEISAVAMPANRRARVTDVKSITTLNSRSDLERALRGEIPLQLSRGAAAKLAAGGWPALLGRASEPADLDLTALASRMDATLNFLKSRS